MIPVTSRDFHRHNKAMHATSEDARVMADVRHH